MSDTCKEADAVNRMIDRSRRDRRHAIEDML